MSANTSQGFLSTHAKSIAALVGMLTIATVLWGGINGVNSWEYRLVRVEETQSALQTTLTNLNTEVRGLRDSISELNITLREVQVRQENLR